MGDGDGGVRDWGLGLGLRVLEALDRGAVRD
jgi:hypothetical protein